MGRGTHARAVPGPGRPTSALAWLVLVAKGALELVLAVLVLACVLAGVVVYYGALLPTAKAYDRLERWLSTRRTRP